MNATCPSLEPRVRPIREAPPSLRVEAACLADTLEQSVRDFIVASDQTLGDIEMQLEQQSRELLRVTDPTATTATRFYRVRQW